MDNPLLKFDISKQAAVLFLFFFSIFNFLILVGISNTSSPFLGWDGIKRKKHAAGQVLLFGLCGYVVPTFAFARGFDPIVYRKNEKEERYIPFEGV